MQKGYWEGMLYGIVITQSYPGMDCLLDRKRRATGTE